MPSLVYVSIAKPPLLHASVTRKYLRSSMTSVQAIGASDPGIQPETVPQTLLLDTDHVLNLVAISSQNSYPL